MSVDPAKLEIVQYPAKILRQRAKPIDKITAEVRAVASRMIELMHQAEGIGLAAPQVGLNWRLFVADVPESDGRSTSTVPPSATPRPVVYINPRLSAASADLAPYEEGCLSLPEIRGDVLRPTTITITALDIEGNEFTTPGTGLLARCWQHEFDHLEGVLIIDKMTQIFRMKNKAAIRDLERQAEPDR